MAEKEVRKTTTKKAVRRTVSKTVSSRTAERKTAPASTRKAPARAAAVPVKKKSSIKLFLAGASLFLVLLGISAAIGFSDKGQLDVEGTIALRKQNAKTPEEQQSLEAVPTEQAQNNVPNGGLVGMGQPEPVAPSPVVGSSTDATASSSSPIASTTPEALPAGAEQPPTEGAEGNAQPQN